MAIKSEHLQICVVHMHPLKLMESGPTSYQTMKVKGYQVLKKREISPQKREKSGKAINY